MEWSPGKDGEEKRVTRIVYVNDGGGQADVEDLREDVQDMVKDCVRDGVQTMTDEKT